MDFSCVGKCASVCTACKGELRSEVIYLTSKLGKSCVLLTLHWSSYSVFAISCKTPSFVPKRYWSPSPKLTWNRWRGTDDKNWRGKLTKADVVAQTVMWETFNPFIDQTRQHLRYVAKRFLKHRSFKPDRDGELACFDYNVMFPLPKPQAVDNSRQIFHEFSSHGWLLWELRNVHMDDYVEFVDDIRHIYLADLGTGPAIEDMVSLLLFFGLNFPRGNINKLFSNFALCAWVMLSHFCLIYNLDLVELAQSM